MVQSQFDLGGRCIAVIGAASGIGEAVALGCAASGATVICLDLNAQGASAVAARAGAGARAASLDICNAGQVRRSLESICRETGRLDGVVCTPGVNVRKPILEYTSEEFDRVVGLNLKGTFQVVQEAGRIMRRQGTGSIVVFSSIRSLTVEPGQGVYAATKAGLVQLVRTLAAELGEHGVRANAIAPGVIDTPLTKPIKDHAGWYQAYADKSALKRWGSADELAGPAIFLLSDAARYVTGTVLFVDGGWTAIDGRFDPPM